MWQRGVETVSSADGVQARAVKLTATTLQRCNGNEVRGVSPASACVQRSGWLGAGRLREWRWVVGIDGGGWSLAVGRFKRLLVGGTWKRWLAGVVGGLAPKKAVTSQQHERVQQWGWGKGAGAGVV
eukprot:297530-Chlamydomonas_euryale.AAC.1